MGNKITRPRRIFKRISLKPAINVTYDINDVKKDECPVVEEEEYIETIHDANFSWLEGRRVSENSTDSIYQLFGRYTEESDHMSRLMHTIFKYVLRGNTRVSLTSTMKNCLHIGSGHYIWLVEMANDNKDIQFEGFDITHTTENNSTPLPSNVNIRRGNIFNGGMCERLPYPDETFDYVNVRSFLTWIPDDKVPFVLEEIRRVTKLNGWVEILEMDPFIKNATPYYENNLGAIWKNICKVQGFSSSSVINMDKLLSKRGFTEVKISKLSIPIGKYGGKVGELYAKQVINGSNAVASLVMDKLEMTNEDVQNYLQECLREFNLKQSYSNSYLVCAKKV